MSRRYLIIDDNPAFADNVAEILRDAGAEVQVALEGQTALEQVRLHRFDAIVTDMRMPGMNGAEVLREVRSIDPGVPVVLLSAYVQDEQLSRARRDGLLAVLSKPHQMTHLIALLDRARRGTVVLVEDDVALAENLAEALAARGLTVVNASTLDQVEELGVEPFAALVDLRVPGGPFGAAINRVRERFPDTPALVITAFSEGLSPEAEVYHKPFDTEALVRRIEELYASGKA